MDQALVVDVLANSKVGTSICISAWVRTRRDSKDFSFIEVNDGSCLKNLQVVVDASLPDYEEQVLQAHTGAAVSIEGEVVESPGKGQRVELKANSFKLVGFCPTDGYPLQKKRHTNEFLRTIAHLRPRTNTFGAVFRTRSALSFAVHKFFAERHFVNLHTPIITTSDCEGAGEMFRVSSLDPNNLPKNDKGEVDHSKDFFGGETSLTVSGQLEAELYACALSNVYTFGPTFRAENSNTPRHLAEFWMIEPEMAFCDLSGDMDLAEEFIKYLIRYALDNCAEDMAFFNQWIEKGIIESLEAVEKASFERITYTDAITALEKSGKKFEFPDSWGSDLQTEHERYLSEEFVKGPVFVTNYPKDIKAFYMRLDEGEKTVSAMDLLVPRCGEIIGGSQREERKDVLERRMKECGLEKDPYWWYFDIREYGSCPHAGFGLGLERLIMYITGMSNIRDVIPFPRVPGNADF